MGQDSPKLADEKKQETPEGKKSSIIARGLDYSPIENPLTILKQRLAKGEITKEQYFDLVKIIGT